MNAPSRRRAVTAAVTAHLDAELRNAYDDVVGTVAREDVVFAGNSLSGPGIDVCETHDQVRERYRGRSTVLAGVDAHDELRTDWYLFLDGVATSRVLATGEHISTRVVSIFPALDPSAGINGEVYLYRRPGATAGGPEVQQRNLTTYGRYVDALRAGKPGDLSEVVSDDLTVVVRSYLPGVPGLARLGSGSEFRRRFETLLEHLSVVSIDPIALISDDWYVFAETEWTVAPRDASGTARSFRLAELYEFGDDGKIVTRIGYGTEPTPA